MSEFTIIYQCFMLILVFIIACEQFYKIIKSRQKFNTFPNVIATGINTPTSLNSTTPYTNLR